MKTKLAIVLVAGLAGLAAWFLYNSIEFYEKEVSSVWSKKALRNPFLAAEQYLEQQGNLVASSDRLNVLENLKDYDTVIISDSRQIFSQARVDELVDWMESGGNLIVGARIYDDDLLLKHFEIKKQHVKSETDNGAEDFVGKKISELLREANEQIQQKDKQDSDAEPEPEPETEAIPDSQITWLTFQGLEGMIRIHFGQDAELVHPALDESTSGKYQGAVPTYWQTNSAGVQFIQLEVGEGMLTVMADSGIWQSANIDTLDHAYLLSILAGGGSRVILLYGMQMPSVFTLLKRHAPELYLSSLIWLLMWLVYRSRRFGPIREKSITTRRSLEEHIMACGNLLWRDKKSSVLLQDMRLALHRKIRRANPGFDTMSNREKAEWLGEKCDMSAFDAEHALFESDSDDEKYFFRITGLIQNIGNKL